MHHFKNKTKLVALGAAKSYFTLNGPYSDLMALRHFSVVGNNMYEILVAKTNSPTVEPAFPHELSLLVEALLWNFA